MVLNVELIETLEELEPSLRQAFIKVLKVLEKRLGEVVKREDFLDLKRVVGELTEAHKQTQAELRKLSEAQRLSEEGMGRLEQAVLELAEAQRRTEQRIEELAEAQKRTEQRIEELAEAQRRTEERVTRLEQVVEELAEAQRRTEQRIEELAEAQRRTEERVTRLEKVVEELAEAQKRTEERVTRLEQAMAALAEAQRKTEETMQRGFKELRDQIAALGSRWGLQSESVFRSTVKSLLEKAGYTVSRGYYGGREVDIVIRDGEHILLEITSSMKKSDVALYIRSAEDYRERTGKLPRIMVAAIYIPPGAMREILDSPVPIEIFTTEEE